MAPMTVDWNALETRVLTYTVRVDLGYIEGVGALFEHETYRAEHGGEIMSQEGAEAVMATFTGMVRTYPDGTPRTKHVTTNLMVEVDGDTATSRCYYTVLQQTDELPLQPIIAGRYHDRFERVDGVWRFADRLIFSDLIGDLSRHLLVDVYGS